MNNPGNNRNNTSTRVPMRAVRMHDRLVKELSLRHPDASPEVLADFSRKVIHDAALVRFMEQQQMLPAYWLREGHKSKALDLHYIIARFDELNQRMRFTLLDLRPYQELDLPLDLVSEWDHDLHLKRFWPNTMPEEILGQILERTLPPSARKGMYSTPSAIVEFILDQALMPLLSKSAEHSGSLYILDPSCGTGNFLIQAFRRLINEFEARFKEQRQRSLFETTVYQPAGKSHLSSEFRVQLIADHLYGVDLDAPALMTARRCLMLMAFSGVSVLEKDIPDLTCLFRNLRQGDSLIDKPIIRQPRLFAEAPLIPVLPFDWRDPETGFGEIMRGGGFHCIVGNPPWLSLKGKHGIRFYDEDVVEYLLNTYSGNTYRPNLFEFFVRRSLELLREDGMSGMIVPDRLADNLQFQKLREYLVAHSQILRLHFRAPFPGVVADTLIYILVKKRKPSFNRKILVTDAEGTSSEISARLWMKSDASAFTGNEEAINKTLAAIEKTGKRKLSDLLATGVGFIAKPGKLTGERVSPRQRPVVKGEHVLPYVRTGNKYFEFDLRNLAGGTRDLKKLAHPDRILMRKTGNRLTAAIDQTADLPEQSLYFLFPQDRRLTRGYDLRYFLGLLNSRVLTFFFRERLITNRSTTPQLKKVHLDQLPLRPINFKDPHQVKLHDRLVQAVELRTALGDKADDADRKTADESIDRLVCDLYQLDDSAREIIERYHAGK